LGIPETGYNFIESRFLPVTSDIATEDSPIATQRFAFLAFAFFTISLMIWLLRWVLQIGTSLPGNFLLIPLLLCIGSILACLWLAARP
jgi:hypothetical protein